MAFDKALHPECDTEGPFGVPMKDAIAKQVEALLKANPGHGDGIVKLASLAEVAAETDRQEVSKITTEAVDRDREVIVAKGINLAPFQSNPVVLLNHDWKSLPLGKSLWIKETGASLTAKSQYAKRPTDHEGEWLPASVFSLIQQNMLPGKSIGFIPLDARAPEKSEIASRPELKDVRRIITKSVLLEYSVVGIPSNPEALVETALKSFPLLAAAMGMKAREDKPTIAAGFVTREELIARANEIARELLNELLAEPLKDIEALKVGIRDVRKSLLRPQPTPRATTKASIWADVASELKKISGAA